jgi:hypothetical protein
MLFPPFFRTLRVSDVTFIIDFVGDFIYAIYHRLALTAEITLFMKTGN